MEFVSTPTMVLGVAMFYPPKAERKGALHTVFTQEMDDVLIEKYATTETNRLAKELKVSPKHVAQRANALGLKKASIWTPEIDNIIRERYPVEKTKDLAKELGVSPELLRNHASVALKLHKDVRFIRKQNKENIYGKNL